MNKPVTVHMFSDASEKAYGCSIYVVTISEAFLTFAKLKAKIASLKSESLAGLDLQAAFVGTRALGMVLLETKLIACEVHAWTDSMTVRQWISQPIVPLENVRR